jgi:GT2 family glycosyltransferase
MGRPPISILIPTRARPAYVEVALRSIAPQAAAAGAEVLLIDDNGPSPEVHALAGRFGARYEPHARPLGLNAARNTGVERSAGELVVFVDDDVRALPGWLEALRTAAAAQPNVDVFTGPIRARLEGRALRGCGREGPPITALDLGPHDTAARYAWGANMAIRRRALERVGPFDVSLEHGGDEQEWQDRLRCAGGGDVLYVADAAVEHRRAGEDARLRALARVAYVRGRAARRFDTRRGDPPARARELETLARCLAHVGLRRCPAGLTMVAHSAGRLRESLRRPAGAPPRSALRPQLRRVPPQPQPQPQNDRGEADDFLSGTSGTVGGVDALRREARDRALDVRELAAGRRLALIRAARRTPACRRVLVLGVERPEHRATGARLRAELAGSRHEVEQRWCAPNAGGKFENLNRLLRQHPPDGHDWLLIADDDVELPHGFLDRFVFLCERFALQLAQPAHRLNSHAAWPQTRRRAGSVVRETAFVEIGPLTAFAATTFATLLPFPELRMGWGLDVHWAALAREHGWRCGVIDALAIRHRAAPAAAAYSREEAIAEARVFLARRPYLDAREAQRTLATHRRW